MKLLAGAIVCLFVLIRASSLSAEELIEPLRRIEALVHAERLDEARQEALRWLKVFPEKVEFQIELGRIEFARRDWRESARWIRRAAQRAPNHPLVRRYSQLLAAIADRHGSFDLWPEAPPDDAGSVERLRRGYFGPTALQTSVPRALPPVDVPDPLFMGTDGVAGADGAVPGLRRLPATEASTAAAAAGIAHGRVPPPRPEGWEARAGHARAREALAAGLPLKAWLQYAALLRLDPTNPDYRLGKAKAALQMGRHDEARQLLRSVLVVHPDHPEARALLDRLP